MHKDKSWAIPLKTLPPFKKVGFPLENQYIQIQKNRACAT